MTWAKSFNFLLERPNQSSAKEKNSSVFLPFLSMFALSILWDRDCLVHLHSNFFQAASTIKQINSKTKRMFHGWDWQTRNRGKDSSLEMLRKDIWHILWQVWPLFPKASYFHCQARWLSSVCDACTAWLQQEGSQTLWKFCLLKCVSREIDTVKTMLWWRLSVHAVSFKFSDRPTFLFHLCKYIHV